MKSVCIIDRFTLPVLFVIGGMLSLPAQSLQSARDNASVGYSSLAYITPSDDFFYFTLNDDHYGLELWRSDGTTTGTYRVKDISPGPTSASPENLIMVCDVLYFTANDGVHGRELWKSDGTADGTVIVKDILAGEGSSRLELLGGDDATLFFQTENEAGDLQQWRSDGTPGGTMPFDDPSYVTSSPYSDNFTALIGSFTMKEERMMFEYGRAWGQRWSSMQAMSPMEEIEVNTLLFFTADQPLHGRELWRSDGTVAGTFMVKDIAPGPASSYAVSTADNMAVLNGHLYFLAQNGRHGTELWRSDGTSKGTKLVKDILPGSGTSSIHALTCINGYLYFSAYDGAHGSEVWRSDGTAAGTVLLKDVTPGAQSSDPRNFTGFHDHVYFSVFGADGVELWRTDGTAAGTSTVFPQGINAVGASTRSTGTLLPAARKFQVSSFRFQVKTDNLSALKP